MSEVNSALLQAYPASVQVQGIPCYAPEMLGREDGYDSSHHGELAHLAKDNWWFRQRNALIVYALTTYFPGAYTYLEVGCGSGVVLQAVKQALPRLDLLGSELFISGLEEASSHVPDVDLIQMDARNIPFTEQFSVIGAYDVIEHIEADDEVLAEMFKAVVPGGGIILTVPQHEWMWSLADEQAHHVRRYTRRSLHDVVQGAGFQVVWSTSFVSLLTAPMMAARLLGGDEKRREDPYVDFRISSQLNDALERVSAVERRLLRAGLRFPIGGSRILVARKRPK